MRRSWVYIDGVAYEKGDAAVLARTQIVPDFDRPYKSMITGEIITSRAKHREHLHRHGYQEIGNEIPIQPKPISAASKTRKELLIAQVNDMTNEQFKAAGKRDLERLRWNTRNIPDPLKEI